MRLLVVDASRGEYSGIGVEVAVQGTIDASVGVISNSRHESKHGGSRERARERPSTPGSSGSGARTWLLVIRLIAAVGIGSLFLRACDASKVGT